MKELKNFSISHLEQQTTYLAAMCFQDVPTCLKFGLRNLSRKNLIEQALDKVLWLVNLIALLLLLHIFLFIKSGCPGMEGGGKRVKSKACLSQRSLATSNLLERQAVGC